MWKISPSTLHRASLSNPFFGFDGAKFYRERLGPLFIDRTKPQTQPPEGRSVDYLDLVQQQHQQPFNPPYNPGNK